MDASTRPFMDKTHAVECQTDVVYGVGGVDYDRATGAARYRDLKLDIYRPRDAGDQPRPALILAFGGAFHRGSKSEEVFEGEAASTSMAEYCREFARRGYVCFSIDYRLMQEAPHPGFTPFLPEGLTYTTERLDYVRGLLGLPPSTPQMLKDTLESSADDMSMAVAFVRSQARTFGVDVTRIAIGGFSAGAVMALNAAYAERAPVAAVVSISGRAAMPVLRRHVTDGPAAPPLLQFHGENDLPDIASAQDGMRTFMAEAGMDSRFVVVPGSGHFYRRTQAVDGTDVETLIATFLHDKLRLGETMMTEALLQAFAEAWNRHDIDGLMSFMTEDCVFNANGGTEVYGTTFRGRDAVRRGFMKSWGDFPDAQWNHPRHAVSGNRGFSEWVFTGTDAAGKRTEVAGCDLFLFRGDKIVVKNSFRKRPAS
jgi:predicted esterase/ketosteroid isomerase-like protein